MAVIVISGMPGCGSSTTAKLLAKKLNMEHYSVGDYNKSHAKHGTETEKGIAMWGALKGKELRRFHIESDKIARQAAKKGNIVIDGKVAIHAVKGKYDFAVWLKSDAKVRAERSAKRDGVPVEVAAEKLSKKERLERRNFRRIYGFDYFGQEKDADLVVDTGDKTPDQIVDEIISKMNAKGLLKS